MIVNNGYYDVIYGVNGSQWLEDYLTIWRAGPLTPFPSLLWGFWPSLKEFLGPSQDSCYCLKVSRRQADNKLFFVQKKKKKSFIFKLNPKNNEIELLSNSVWMDVKVMINVYDKKWLPGKGRNMREEFSFHLRSWI